MLKTLKYDPIPGETVPLRRKKLNPFRGFLTYFASITESLCYFSSAPTLYFPPTFWTHCRKRSSHSFQQCAQRMSNEGARSQPGMLAWLADYGRIFVLVYRIRDGWWGGGRGRGAADASNCCRASDGRTTSQQ
jgi:hypothetical protein